MIEVELPDGRVIDVDTSDPAVAASAARKFMGGVQQEPSSSPGFMEKIGKLWDNPPPGPSLIGMAKQLYSGVTAPGDALAGKLDVNSPEAIGRTTALAGVPMLASTAAPRGALGTGFVRPSRGNIATEPATQPGALLQAAERIDVPVPKFLASEDMTTQRLAAGLKNIPGAGDRIFKSTQETVQSLGGAATKAADEVGTGSVPVAGSASKDALAHWITEKSGDIASRLYNAVDPLVKDTPRELFATRKTVSEIMARRANSKIPGASPAVELVGEAIATPGGLNYQGVKGLRTFLGEMTPEEMVARGVNKAEAKQLYGALTQDLKGTILDAGGPKALNAFERANSTFEIIAERRKALAKIIGTKGDAAPEAVFAKLTAMAGSKSSADIGRLVLARKAMGVEAWNEVSSAVIARLGRDPQGNFSPDRFFTAYGNISPNAKSVLFKSTGRDDVARSLDDINIVVNGIKERITKFGNPSGTAQNLIGASMAGSAFVDPWGFVKALGGVLGGNALAVALSKPATAKAIASVVKSSDIVSRQPSASALTLHQTALRNLVNLLGGGTDLAAKLQSVTPGRGEDQNVPAMRM